MRNQRKPISQVVDELVKKSGLTLNEIERKTDGRLSHSFLSKLIGGQSSNPQVNKLIELADFFGVSGYVMLGEEEPEEFREFKEGKFGRLFKAYAELERARHRKMVEDGLDELFGDIEGMPNKKRED